MIRAGGIGLGERALGIGLGLLTLSLWIGPVVAAFNLNDWSLKETIMPGQDQMDNIENRVKGLMGDNTSMRVSVLDYEVEAPDISLRISLSHPFNFNATIKKYSGKLVDRESDEVLADFQLKNEAEIKPGESVILNLGGTLTSRGEEEFGRSPEDGFQFEVSGEVLSLEASGVSVEIALEELEETSSEKPRTGREVKE